VEKGNVTHWEQQRPAGLPHADSHERSEEDVNRGGNAEGGSPGERGPRRSRIFEIAQEIKMDEDGVRVGNTTQTHGLVTVCGGRRAVQDEDKNCPQSAWKTRTKTVIPSGKFKIQTSVKAEGA